ncbi:MAG TPA: hypothetical protein VEO02_14260 [Thermoanaerobaculia bacterium]|nr:hypothetical protein [Thermoanaerobaculia bacterium]
MSKQTLAGHGRQLDISWPSHGREEARAAGASGPGGIRLVVEAASGRATSRCARRAQISPGTRATVLVELNGIEPSTS